MGIGNFSVNKQKDQTGYDFAAPKIVPIINPNPKDKKNKRSKAVIFAIPATAGEEGAYELTKGEKSANPGEKYYVKGGNMISGILSDIKMYEDNFGNTSVAMVLKEPGTRPVQVKFSLVNSSNGAANRATLTLLTQLLNADVGEEMHIAAFLEPAGVYKDQEGREFERKYDHISYSVFQPHLIDMTPDETGKPVNATGYVRFDRKSVPVQPMGIYKNNGVVPIAKKTDAPKNAVIIYESEPILEWARSTVEELKSRIGNAYKVRQPTDQPHLNDDDDVVFGEDDNDEQARSRMGARVS